MKHIKELLKEELVSIGVDESILTDEVLYECKELISVLFLYRSDYLYRIKKDYVDIYKVDMSSDKVELLEKVYYYKESVYKHEQVKDDIDRDVVNVVDNLQLISYDNYDSILFRTAGICDGMFIFNKDEIRSGCIKYRGTFKRFVIGKLGGVSIITHDTEYIFKNGKFKKYDI